MPNNRVQVWNAASPAWKVLGRTYWLLFLSLSAGSPGLRGSSEAAAKFPENRPDT